MEDTPNLTPNLPHHDRRKDMRLEPNLQGWDSSIRSTLSSKAEDSLGTSFRTSLRTHTTRCSMSFLHGAANLTRMNNDIEAPKVQSYTTDIDGRPLTFALVNNVSKLPKISRSQRTPTRAVNLNVHHSSYRGRAEHRVQRWLTKRSIPALTTLHLAAFLAVNTIFSVFWYLEDGGCCEKEMSFAQTFDFAVHTSSTIGYGVYSPTGMLNNALVVLLMSVSICLSTVYAGLLFFKFITPTANIEFSEVIAMSNVMQVPCLEIRVGNADGDSNMLINAEANMCITSVQLYKCPHEFDFRHTSQTEELKLAVSHKHKLDGVWTLRHFVDEDSPLYGMRFDEYPGNTIKAVEVNVKAVHESTKGEVCSQATFQVEDILVGQRFEEQYTWDAETQTEYYDYSKLSSTKPSMVWYPKGIADIHDA
mmetsp:Transcript_23739/g.58185  ORF Transcript_23739/g.58185 Transcript_23739/m.58185 type:complete len:419 (-) Transcript_23739:443-1699(-)